MKSIPKERWPDEFLDVFEILCDYEPGNGSPWSKRETNKLMNLVRFYGKDYDTISKFM